MKWKSLPPTLSNHFLILYIKRKLEAVNVPVIKEPAKIKHSEQFSKIVQQQNRKDETN